MGYMIIPYLCRKKLLFANEHKKQKKSPHSPRHEEKIYIKTMTIVISLLQILRL